MRVLHLNTHSSGGSYEYAALLSTALAEQGIESHVFCKNSPSAEDGRLLLDRVIRRSYVSFSTEPWHGTRRLLSPPMPKELAGVDVVHLHMVADWFDVPGWLEKLPTNIGLVISLHDLWHVTGGCFLYRGCDRYANETHPCDPCPILKWPANRFLAKAAHSRKLWAYRNCGARMVANSQWLAGIAEQSPIAKACGGVRVVPPGIDTAIFRPQDKRQCREKLALPEDSFVIATGSASLTDTNKNVPWLLEQLSHLPDPENVRVLAFGEGNVPVPDYLEVQFTGGLVDRRNLARVFAAADVFVTASLMETYGLTLLEAMACGTPVAAFRTGGIPEAAPHEKVGLLCTPHDGSALLAAVGKLRSSPHLREQFGSAASELALTRNDKTRFAGAFAQIYRDCLKAIRTGAGSQLVVQV
jgi:glycosyltransferase involved in cell wall biosynthesis